ncbi:MAG TPA: ABC transporter ATP-binding protein [Nocardioidaceae bacterium]|nr:ABC transporter ATP-binding protein [Nocardioidaceae bacterium]
MGVIEGPTEAVPAPADSTVRAAIEAHGLHKAYRDRLAVSSIDLEVAPGTILGLLGPNGAGKTTLIRMLSTVLTPDEGSFAVAGAAHTEPELVRQRVGVLPESPGYPRNQTCAEWLGYHARLYGASRNDARATAEHLLSEVGLNERSGSLIAGLSRGMRQRLGIARALVNDPIVVFLDEPTLGLDPLGQRQVLDLVQRIARDRGVTVVLSTHVLGEVELACNRVVILNRGRVVADGTVAEVVRQAAAARQAVVKVPPYLRTVAVGALSAHDLVAVDITHDGQPDEITLQFPGDELPEQSSALALRCLLDAGVPVLGLSVEGGRLSDAFLAVTRGSDDG